MDRNKEKLDAKADVLKEACLALLGDGQLQAGPIIKDRYPFVPLSTQSRRWTPQQSVGVFIKDGFLDRYSGARLIFPGALLLLSHLSPEEFPYHPHWKMSKTHPAYWELYPTIDHIVPIARGGQDHPSNCVCTSMLHNAAKANWTLEELGWELHEPGDMRDWDGLSSVFLALIEKQAEALTVSAIRNWYYALKKLRGKA